MEAEQAALKQKLLFLEMQHFAALWPDVRYQGVVMTDGGMLSRCMAASTTSLLVAVGSEAGHLRLLDCRQQSLSVLQRLRIATERLSSVAFSPDGAFVAVSCPDRQGLKVKRPSTAGP